MAIELTSEVEQMLERKLSEGSYSSADELIEAALDALRDNEARASELRRMIEQGLEDSAAGRYVEFSSAQQARELFATMPHRAVEE